ncbi:MAG: tetratricopeptide repeat protein [Thiothrix sp.]
MQVSSELLQLLSQAAYIACFRGDTKRSQVIMEGVSVMGKEQIPIKIGLVIVNFYAGQYRQAVDILRGQVLQEEPEHMTAKCFLGMSLKQLGEVAEAKEFLEEVVHKGSKDERELAAAYLN